MFTVFLVIQIIITLALVGMILVQRSDSDGLSGLSGGGGGGANSFMTGRAAATFMTRGTAILATIFMVNSLWLAKLSTDSRSAGSLADRIALEEDNPLNDPLAGDVTDEEAGIVLDQANEAAPAPQVPLDGETTTPANDNMAPAVPAEPAEAPEVPTPN